MPKTIATKAERLETRVSVRLKEKILLAATIEGKSLTEFTTDKLEQAADKVINDQVNWKLTQADSARFVEALLEPQPLAPNLVDSIRRYRHRMSL